MPTDREYRIKISTSADTAGAVDTEKKLKDLNTSMGEGFKASSNLTEATKKYVSGLKDTGDQSVSVHEKMHILHAVLRDLGPDFEGIGREAMLAFTPLGAVVAGAVAVFAHFRGEIDELNRSSDEMGKAAAAAIGNMTESIQEARKELGKLRTDAATWRAEMSQNPGAADTLLETQLKRLKELESATLEIIRAQEKAGLIKSGTADALENKTKTATGAAEEEATRRALGTDIANQQRAARREAEAEKSEQNPTRLAEIQDLPKQIKDTQDYLAKLKSERDAALAKETGIEQEGFFMKRFASIWSGEAHATRLEDAMAKLASLNDSITVVSGILGKQSSKLSTLTDEQTAAATAVRDSRTAYERLTKAVMAHAQELEDLRFSNNLSGNLRDYLEQLKNFASGNGY